MSYSSSDWWRKGFEANVTIIESLIKEELDINTNNYAYGHQLFISLITFLKSKSRNNNLDNNRSLILPTEAIKVNKSAKKKEDMASEVPRGILTTWNGGVSNRTNSLLLNNVNSGASYSSTKPNVDEEGRKKVNLSGLSKKRAHQEVNIPMDFENLLFSVTNPTSDHALLATPRNLDNEPAKKKKDEANELAKKKDEAKELEKKMKEEAIELAKKKKEEAIELAKKKKEEANELAKKKKEEAIELAKKKKEEAIELAKKKKEEAIELAKKKKEEAIELAKKKEEAIELAKKKKEEAIELAKKKKEEAIELAKKKKEEAMELARKKKEEANELAKKKKEVANELAKKKKDEANELAKKKKDEASASSTKPTVNKEGSKLDNLVRPLSKKRAHKEVSTPQKNGKLLPSVTNPEADHAHVTTPTNLDSLTNATQLNNIPGMSSLASSYYSNVGNITSSLAVKGVADVVDDSTTKCPKDITQGDTTSLYGGISRKINFLFDKYVNLEPTGLSNYIDIDEEMAHPLSSKQPLMEISSSPWNDELLSSSNSTNVTDPKTLDSKASLQEVIPYVSIDELDTYEDSKTCNFSQHLIQWSDDKVNSGALQVWTGEHDKSFEDQHVWDLVEEPISDALQVYTGDDIKPINTEHVWDLVEVEPISDALPVYTDDTKSIKYEHVWDLVEEDPKYGALQIYTGDETKSSKDEHVWDLVKDEPNNDCLNSVHHPKKRAKRSASSSQSDIQTPALSHPLHWNKGK